MKKVRRLLKIIGLGLSVGICALGVTSCSSSKKEAYISNFQTVECRYYSESDKTKVYWYSDLRNDSIYNMERESIAFDLYNNETFVKTETYNYAIVVKHGQTDSSKRWFETSGKITDIKLNYWTAEFSNVWNTYKAWFIATIVVASAISIAYVILMIINDLELGDTWEFLIEHLWLLPLFFTGFVMYIITSIIASVWSWVPPLIVLGGLIALILIALFGHLIKYIVDYCSFGGCYVPEYIIQDEQKKTTPKKESSKAKKSSKKTSSIKFEDIAGLEEVKKAFNEKVIMPFEHPELFKKFGKKAGGGILLYGLPGTGKTMFAEAAANELDALFIPVKCSDIKSKWYGESEANVKEIFERARTAKKAIIFFDEFEAIGAKRTDNGDNANNDLVPQILAEMQGVGTSNDNTTLIVIAATNKPWAIDSAFLRPGRFDEKIYVPLPDFDARKKLFELQLKKLPISDDLDFDYLANITDGFNGADIKEVCEKLKMSAINDSLEKGKDQTIGMDDVHRIENTLKSSVSIEDIEKIKEFESR